MSLSSIINSITGCCTNPDPNSASDGDSHSPALTDEEEQSKYTRATHVTNTTSASRRKNKPLTEYQRLQKIQKDYGLSHKTISDYRFTFDRLDVDQNGTLDTMELRNAFFFWKEEVTDGELKMILEKYDEDKNGTIDFPEFAAMLAEKQQSTKLEQEYAETFKSFDVDGNGLISEQELMDGLQGMDLDCEEDEIRDMMKLVNRDKDGQMRYTEFIKLLRYNELLD